MTHNGTALRRLDNRIPSAGTVPPWRRYAARLCENGYLCFEVHYTIEVSNFIILSLLANLHFLLIINIRNGFIIVQSLFIAQIRQRLFTSAAYLRQYG